MYSKYAIKIRVFLVLCAAVEFAISITSTASERSRQRADDFEIWREMYMKLAARSGYLVPEGKMGHSEETDNFMATGENTTELFNELRDIYGSVSSLSTDAVVVNEKTSDKVSVDMSDGWNSVAASVQPEERQSKNVVATKTKHKTNGLRNTEGSRKTGNAEKGSTRENGKNVADASTHRTKAVSKHRRRNGGGGEGAVPQYFSWYMLSPQFSRRNQIRPPPTVNANEAK